MTHAKTLLAALALALGTHTLVWADVTPGNDSDALVVTITPNVDIGVDIDTAAVTLAFTLAPGATDYTASPATVTILGTQQPQEVDVQATALDNWSIDADETPAANSLQLYAVFAVGRSSRPVESEFAGTARLVTTSAVRAGGSAGAGVQFEQASMLGPADMDSLNINDTRQLWLRFDAPPLTGYSANQRFQVKLTATTTNL